MKIMSFFLEEEVDVSFEFEYRELAEKIVEYCLDYAKFPYEAEINLTLTDNEGIHAINKEFREIDRPTDVLSFPMLNYETPGDFSFLDDEDSDDFNPDTGEALLGDIVISIEKVYEQAENYGHSTEREYAFLITHSMLHLFGYDHMEEQEAKVMEEKQREILEQMNILR
jgi:probable rRNA maturation factor